MPLSRFQVTTLPELRFLTPLSDGVRSSLNPVSGISTIPTVLLPNHKHGELRFRALLSESGFDRLELARCLP